MYSASVSASSGNYAVGTAGLILSSSTADYLELPFSITPGSNGLSFAFWFKANSAPNGARIFEFSNTFMFDDIIDDITVIIRNNILSAEVMVTNAPTVSKSNLFNSLSVNDNNWRHVVWTISTSGTWLFYLNGNQADSCTGVYPSTVARNANALGFDGIPGDPTLNGVIDEFYFFNSVLTAAQVQGLYNQKNF